MITKPVVAILPTGQLFDELFTPDVLKYLESFAEIKFNTSKTRLDSRALVEFLDGTTGCITSWGSPSLTAEIAAKLPDLKFMGHAAGTLRGFTEPAVLRSGVTVSHAAPIIAIGVGEMALCLTLALLRNIGPHDRAMRSKMVRESGSGHYFGSDEHRYTEGLFDQKVGLIGFGYTARQFATRLKSFTTDIAAYDPFIDPKIADEYGVRMTTLDDVLNSKVVSLHASSIPQSYHIINTETLALIPDGSVLINTARGTLIDEAALADELRTGRLRAGIDVWDPEPPTPNNPLRDMENIIMTPHISGPTRDRRWTMAMAMAEEFRRFLDGEPLKYQLDVNRWDIMG